MATYTVKQQVDTIINTKDTSQTEGPRWTPAYTPWVESTIHDYNEWADAIGGPEKVTKVEYTYDDLVTKY